MPGFISNSLLNIKSKMIQVAKEANRPIEQIHLIAVSKTKSTEQIKEALLAGQSDFAENYVQEWAQKHKDLQDQILRWHFIGHLQRNKAKEVVGHVFLIHSLDRYSLAETIDRLAAVQNRVQNCLLQVKLSDEESKSGCTMAEVLPLLKKLTTLRHVQIKGLMGISSANATPEVAKQEFSRLRRLRDKINKEQLYRSPITELSMGMSGDFEIAIQEGATLIRVGTAIFGKR